ncbi:membrane protein [Steroidobacter agaridevorans]|uniref:Membrane protein n=1 Tax=Steroidobacter agaridevorans TaxID=2695856 RepID=A0A829Y9L8_9GAMM|nr:ABC transporter permease [Steroidobacter agaridevorans]GFE79693.1 membrane protein [Steroidobacter agaridevorans]GFE90765.1 membrane protein [Steroidobacter agaridevorans]
MKFLPLVWTALWHRPARTVFTLLSIVAAFVLFGSLQGLNAGFDKAVVDQQLDTLITDSRVPGGPAMPVAALREIEELPGVVLATQRATLIGWYQQPKNTVAVIAADAAKWFSIRPRLAVATEQMNALLATRTGMLATPALQSYYGWKIGDKIPLQTSLPKRDGSRSWTFDLVGTFDVSDNPGKAYLSVINYDYFDAERTSEIGTAERFLIRIADPNRSARTALAIDGLFANSSHQTRTRSEKEIAQSRLKQIGDIRFLTNAVVGSVLFTLLFVTGNTMRQSVRERTPEFGVLKALGSSDGGILLLVLAEALTLCVLAAMLGLGIALAAAPLLEEVIGVVEFSWRVIANGIFVAGLLALVSAVVPAWSIWRSSVVDALDRR